ncbi:MAG: hypothetical protein KAS30_01555 [Candidatus Diapherotrites archaeon]|nr:hypothetical protein [Candidatus Diapherotrites archaeon]
MSNGVQITKDDTDKVIANIRAMANLELLVGIPAKKTQRRGDTEPISNASLGLIFNNGSALRNMPPTHYLENGVKDAQPKIVEALKVGASDGLEDKKAVEKALNKAGLIAVSTVKGNIVAGKGLPTPEEAGKKYMINTGQFLNSHTYVIRKK